MMDIEKLAREALSYDPETGEVRWKADRGKAKAGSVAGCFDASTGYRRITINKRHFYAHRLAWLLQHGVMPSGEIDHINGNRLDNRLENLRDVSHAGNQQNRRNVRSKNRAGFLGVHNDGGRWRATLDVNGKRVNIGTFGSPEEAHKAYVDAKRRLHETCTI